MNNKKLIITLIIQVLIFTITGLNFYINREKYIKEFYLKTIPFDPRDYLSGTYIRLRFEIENEILKCIKESINKKKKTPYIYGTISIDFKDSGERFVTKDGKEKSFYKISNCYDGIRKEKGLAIIHYDYDTSNKKIIYNLPTRFYLNENDVRKNLSLNKMAVKVRILKDHSLGIIDIEEIKNNKN